MARKAREMSMKAKEAEKYGRVPGGMGFGSSMSGGMGGGGGGGGMGGPRELPVADGFAGERERRAAEANSAAKAAASQGSSKALRLGKPRDEDAFLEKLKDEGESALTGPFVYLYLRNLHLVYTLTIVNQYLCLCRGAVCEANCTRLEERSGRQGEAGVIEARRPDGAARAALR